MVHIYSITQEADICVDLPLLAPGSAALVPLTLLADAEPAEHDVQYLLNPNMPSDFPNFPRSVSQLLGADDNITPIYIGSH